MSFWRDSERGRALQHQSKNEDDEVIKNLSVRSCQRSIRLPLVFR